MMRNSKIYNNRNNFKSYLFNIDKKAFYRILAKSKLQITPELNEIVIGSMLGDLTAEKRKENHNTRLQFKQSTKNSVYINHLYSLFQEFCGSKPITMSYFDSRLNKMKNYYSIKFQTLSLPCFNIYKELFYNTEGIKIVPSNIEELLTTRGLAYWIMDDGYKYNKGFYLCTESFTLNEHQILINTLKNKFNLDSSSHVTTNGYRLYIFSTSRYKLIDLIKPYLINHFYYKFELE